MEKKELENYSLEQSGVQGTGFIRMNGDTRAKETIFTV